MREVLKDPVRAWTRISAPDRERFTAHAVALAAVIGAAIVSWIAGVPAVTAPFMLFTLAVAFSAATGGAPAAITAVLAALLLARTIDAAPWRLCLLFAIEAGAVAALVVRLSDALKQQREWLEEADTALRGLRQVERRGRRIAAAFACLQGASREHLTVTLDRDGRIAEWGDAPTEVYGVQAADVVGSSGAELFGATDSASFEAVLAEARTGAYPTARARHVRADGTGFDAAVELRPLPHRAGDGFTLLIHDLSREQAEELATRQAAERERSLREEAELATLQLAGVRSVSDPHFDAMPGVHGATALLERLRSEVSADGIAIVRGSYRESFLSAPSGLQPEPSRLQGEVRPQRVRRTVLIQNDPARVSEMTSVGWPDDVRTLIAVPVIRGGEVEAMIEVAYLRGRRSTEWEIALIQIAATRVTGLLHEASYPKTGAVA